MTDNLHSFVISFEYCEKFSKICIQTALILWFRDVIKWKEKVVNKTHLSTIGQIAAQAGSTFAYTVAGGPCKSFLVIVKTLFSGWFENWYLLGIR